MLTISTPIAGIALGSTTTQNIAISDNVPTSVDFSLYVRIGRYDLTNAPRSSSKSSMETAVRMRSSSCERMKHTRSN
jgi:hypothetical protein